MKLFESVEELYRGFEVGLFDLEGLAVGVVRSLVAEAHIEMVRHKTVSNSLVLVQLVSRISIVYFISKYNTVESLSKMGSSIPNTIRRPFWSVI